MRTGYLLLGRCKATPSLHKGSHICATANQHVVSVNTGSLKKTASLQEGQGLGLWQEFIDNRARFSVGRTCFRRLRTCLQE